MRKSCRKNQFLSALEAKLGNVTRACKATGISRTLYYMWMKEDEDFASRVHEIADVTGDFVEDKLLQRINEGDTTAIIFYCKTKLKHRGYCERHEVTGAGGKDLFAGMSDEDLDLQIEELKRKLGK